jgi:hypothetical protein
MPTPGAFLGLQETIRASIAQGTLFAYPRIHSLWHIVSHPRSPLGPYGMGHCQPPGFHGLWNIRAILAGMGDKARRIPDPKTLTKFRSYRRYHGRETK